MLGKITKSEPKKTKSKADYLRLTVSVSGTGEIITGSFWPSNTQAEPKDLVPGKTISFEIEKKGDFINLKDVLIDIPVTTTPPEAADTSKIVSSYEKIEDGYLRRDTYIARECASKLTEKYMEVLAKLGLSCSPMTLGNLAKFWLYFIQTGEIEETPFSKSRLWDKPQFDFDIETELADNAGYSTQQNKPNADKKTTGIPARSVFCPALPTKGEIEILFRAGDVAGISEGGMHLLFMAAGQEKPNSKYLSRKQCSDIMSFIKYYENPKEEVPEKDIVSGLYRLARMNAPDLAPNIESPRGLFEELLNYEIRT